MPEPEKTETVTDDQAGQALSDLLKFGEPEKEPEVQPSETTEPAPEQTAPAVTEIEEIKEPEPESAGEVVQEPESDDVESLKQRLAQAEEERKASEERSQKRLEAIQRRNEESVRILQDRYLRKSSAADQAAKVLEAALKEEGVSQDDAKRVLDNLRGTYNEASAGYVPPTDGQTPVAQDRIIVLNNFLNEKGMSTEDADEFEKWIKTDAEGAMTQAEKNLVNESLGGFLRLAHSRWKEGVREKDRAAREADAIGATKSVQRVQKQAAKAASATPRAPKTQPAGKKAGVDVKELTHDDISALLRQSVTQHS